MLRTTILRNEHTDIVYPRLLAYLKKNSNGYKPVKSLVFEGHHIARFLAEANDREFLCLKVKNTLMSDSKFYILFPFLQVFMIFGFYGATRANELVKLTLADVMEKNDIFLIQIMETKNKVDRSFIVQNEYAEYIRRYMALRKANTPHDRFFVNYQQGKCTFQPIGKNKFYDAPKNIASFLGLEDSKKYTGHSFRRSSSTICADGGADIDMVMKLGGWKTPSTARGYVENSMASKTKIYETISSEITKQSSVKRPSVSSTVTSGSMDTSTSFIESSTVLSQCVRWKGNIIDEPSETESDHGSMKFENLEGCTFNFKRPKVVCSNTSGTSIEGSGSYVKVSENERSMKFEKLKNCTFNFNAE